MSYRWTIALLCCSALLACEKQEPVRLVLLGDTGTGDAAQAQVASMLATTCDTLGCEAVLLLGDNFYPTGVASVDDPQWQTAFDTPYAAIAAPFLAVLGNHDYGGFGLGFEKDRAAAQVAMGSSGGKFVMPHHFYLRTIGNVDIFALDTSAIMFHDMEDQRAAVREWLKESDARWKVVIGHHPYLSNGTHGDAGAFDGFDASSDYSGVTWREFFASELCGKVDIYVAGHEHDLDWPIPEAGCAKPELIISGGGGASPRETSDRHPARYTNSVRGFFWLELSQQATAQVMEVDHVPVVVHQWKPLRD